MFRFLTGISPEKGILVKRPAGGGPWPAYGGSSGFELYSFASAKVGKALNVQRNLTNKAKRKRKKGTLPAVLEKLPQQLNSHVLPIRC